MAQLPLETIQAVSPECSQSEVPYTFTLFHHSKPLSKVLTLEGVELKAKPSAAGIGAHVQVQQSADISEFAAGVHGMAPHQALAFGTPPTYHSILCLKKDLATKGDGYVSRSRDCFTFQESPGILALDYDVKENALSRDELLRELYEVWPALSGAPHVWKPSASSHIYSGDEEIRGLRGQRIYVGVEKASDIPRIIRTLADRLWLAHKGHYVVSKAGRLLKRSLIDDSMGQPERLDFCGGAQCNQPLRQEKAVPVVYNPDAPPLNTLSTLESLSTEELEKLEKIQADYAAICQPDAEEAQAKWVEERVASHALSEKAVKDVYADNYLAAVRNQILFADFKLHTTMGIVTVGEMLNDRAKYNGVKLRDPLEPDYNDNASVAQAQLYSNRGPIIYSYAHGGISYKLTQTRHHVKLEDGKLREIRDQICEILSDDGDIFRVDKKLIEIHQGEVEYSPFNVHTFQYKIGGLARFSRYDAKKKKEIVADCPTNIATAILSSHNLWNQPELKGIAQHPVVLSDGNLSSKSGYDKETGLYILNNDYTIPENPTLDQCKKAYVVLTWAFREFPFANSFALTALVSAALSAVNVAAYPNTPAISISSPMAGTGKTLIQSMLCYLAEGKSVPIASLSQDKNELSKELFARLLGGASVIPYDNCEGVIKHKDLLAVLTSERWSARILGLSEIVKVNARALLIFNGNNITIAADMSRRVLEMRLDRSDENPALKKFDFDPLFEVKTHYKEIVQAALTLMMGARGYKTDKVLGSFEGWSNTVAKTVEWIAHSGIDASLCNPIDIVTDTLFFDPVRIRKNQLIAKMVEVFGRDKFVAKDVFGNPMFHEFEDLLNFESPLKVGYSLKRLDGWIIGRDKFKVERGAQMNEFFIAFQ